MKLLPFKTQNHQVFNVDDLKDRITEASATIDNATLGRVWQEMDVCRVTNGAHIEHL